MLVLKTRNIAVCSEIASNRVPDGGVKIGHPHAAPPAHAPPPPRVLRRTSIKRICFIFFCSTKIFQLVLIMFHYE